MLLPSQQVCTTSLTIDQPEEDRSDDTETRIMTYLRFRCAWNKVLLPPFRSSFFRFLLTFSASADKYIKRWQSLARGSENSYSPSDLFLCSFLFVDRSRAVDSVCFSASDSNGSTSSSSSALCAIDLNIRNPSTQAAFVKLTYDCKICKGNTSRL